MNDLKIGVLIPSYNHSAFIERCLDSILSGSKSGIPIIVCDDGSNDETVEVVEKYIKADSFATAAISLVTHEKNLGSVETLNREIQKCDWDWVILCNSDDEFGAGRLAAILNAINQKGPHTWGFSKVEYIDEFGTVRNQQTTRHVEEFDTLIAIWGRLEFALLVSNFAVSTGNLFFTRALWEEIGGFHDLSHVHDWDFCLQAMTRTAPLFLDESVYRYRTHGGNTFTQIHASVSQAEVSQVYRRFMQVARSSTFSGCPSARNFPGIWESFVRRFDRRELS